MVEDIVVDTTVMRLYGVAKDPTFKAFFAWLRGKGTLACSKKLLMEYGRVQSMFITTLMDELIRSGRFQNYAKERIAKIKDSHFQYRCNYEDRWHLRLVMCTYRRLCLSQDNKLVEDVNCFSGFYARAARNPGELDYK